MAGEKTEKATPKRRDEARRKGQVARSMDVNGAVVMAAGLVALIAFGPGIWNQMRAGMEETFAMIANPGLVDGRNLSHLALTNVRAIGMAVAPIAAACVVSGVLASLGQVKWKPSPQAMKPDAKRLDPLKGAKNIFGPHAIFEAGKSIAKLLVVGGIAAIAVFPELPQLAALVGLPPAALGSRLVDTLLDIAVRAVAAYLLIAAIDYAYQRWRHEKSLKMDPQEVKDEMKQQALPPEVRGAMRRRQVQQARARMMAAVPQADVVVTNPTHFAVALAYNGSKPAPEVVAKGQDLIAKQIRQIAEEHGVPVVEDPPLARGLHGSVEVGREIPESFFQAVAQVLAFVYRTARRRAA